MWRLCKLGYQHEPGLILAAFLLSLLAALPDALLAVWLSFLAGACEEGDAGLLRWAAVGLAASAVATWFLRTVSTRVQRRFRDKVTHRPRGPRGAAAGRRSPPSPTRSGPSYLDRLSVLRDQIFVLDHMYMSVFSHERVDPAPRRHRRPAGVDRPGAGPARRLRPAHGAHLDVAARRSSARRMERAAPSRAPGPPPVHHRHHRAAGQGGAGHRHRRPPRRPTAGRRGSAGTARWRRPATPAPCGTRSAGSSSGSPTSVRSSTWPRASTGRPQDVLLVLAAGVAALGLHRRDRRRDRLPARHLDGRLPPAGLARGLRRRARRPTPTSRCPTASTTGIVLEHVSFAYPGTDRLCSTTCRVTLPAGAVVAVVGENGAGKSTLVKLLSKFYEPTAGRILVDGRPLARMPADEWRAPAGRRVPGLLPVRAAGPSTRSASATCPGSTTSPPSPTAVDRAGADDVVDQLGAGLDTQLGPTWPEGVEVSFGQWQKLALARGFMRDEPLLLVLDEPTAALDAETEHAAVRALRRRRPPRRRRPAASRSSCRTGSAPCAWPTSSWCSTAPASSRSAPTRSWWPSGGQYAELYDIQATAYR